jgi:hypothetical protein
MRVQVGLRGRPGGQFVTRWDRRAPRTRSYRAAKSKERETVSVATHHIPSQRARRASSAVRSVFAPTTDRTSSRRGRRDERTTPGSGLGARETWPTASTTVQKNKTKVRRRKKTSARAWSTRAGTTSNSGARLEAARFATRFPASAVCFIIEGPGLPFAAARAACSAGQHCRRGAQLSLALLSLHWQWAAVKTAACLCRWSSVGVAPAA